MRFIIAENDVHKLKALSSIVRCIFPDSQVDEVGNGLDLLEKVQDREYNLIITDYQMPDMNGFEAVSAIRQFDQVTPAWLYSGSDGPDFEERARNSGITRIYRKSEMDTNKLESDLRSLRNSKENPQLVIK